MDTFKASSHRGSPKEKLIALLRPLALSAFIISLFAFNHRFLRVTSITCLMGEQPCPEAIRNLAETYTGRSILLIRQRDISREAVATGLAETAKVSVRFPGELMIDITPPTLSFYLNAVFGASPPGLSFETATTSAEVIRPSVELANFVAASPAKTFRLLPSGVLNQADATSNYYLISEQIPQKDYLLGAFTWLTALSDAKSSSGTVYFLPDLLVVSLADEPDYLFNPSADPITSLAALQRLNSAVTIRELGVIDFRYTNPILK